MTAVNRITIGGAPDFAMHREKTHFAHTATFEMSEGGYLFKERFASHSLQDLAQGLKEKMSGQGWTGRKKIEWSARNIPSGNLICGGRNLRIHYQIPSELAPQQVLFLSNEFRLRFD